MWRGGWASQQAAGSPSNRAWLCQGEAPAGRRQQGDGRERGNRGSAWVPPPQRSWWLRTPQKFRWVWRAGEAWKDRNPALTRGGEGPAACSLAREEASCGLEEVLKGPLMSPQEPPPLRRPALPCPACSGLALPDLPWGPACPSLLFLEGSASAVPKAARISKLRPVFPLTCGPVSLFSACPTFLPAAVQKDTENRPSSSLAQFSLWG